MANNLETDKEKYLAMTCKYKDKNHMLDIIFPIKLQSFKSKEDKFLMLVNKHFPSPTVISNDSEINWDDFLQKENELAKTIGGLIAYINIPVWYNIEDVLLKSNISENGISVYFDIDHDGNEILILSFLCNVFTNKNFIEKYSDGIGWKKVWVDQTISATLNRKNLKAFLKDLEDQLKVSIIEFASGYIEKEFTFKYGFIEEAKLYFYEGE